MQKREWQRVANAEARRAHEENFSTHRGTLAIMEGEVLVAVCAYDNSPYAKFPGLREAQLEELVQKAKARGIDKVAAATYPKAGKHRRYTSVLIFASDDDDAEESIREAWNEVLGALRPGKLRLVQGGNAKRRSGKGKRP